MQFQALSHARCQGCMRSTAECGQAKRRRCRRRLLPTRHVHARTPRPKHPPPQHTRTTQQQGDTQPQHTIVLVQPLRPRSSRTFLDFQSVAAAADGAFLLRLSSRRRADPTSHPSTTTTTRQTPPRTQHHTHALEKPKPKTTKKQGLVAMFERRLRELNPAMRSLTYELRDGAVYLDSLVRVGRCVLLAACCVLRVLCAVWWCCCCGD